jgi:TonB-dependent starch-binding outer membrane protein SusC
MKNRLLKGLLVFLTVLFAGFAQAQDITGTVSDSSGPLPGASVVVKGTTNSASTDLNGKYAIKNAGANAVLVFSYIGLSNQEVSAAGKSVVNVVLKDDQQKLNEVIVIGYGTVKKKDATSAVDQLNSKNIDNVAANNPAEILRGKVAGVQVTSSSGEPGGAMSIRVRGNSSIRSGNGPLIVVDGVPLDGGDISGGGNDVLGTSSARSPLNFINQNDIESLSILKDVSATAIYGVRGANGVILITTKKAKSSEPQFTYNSSVAFSNYSSKFEGVLSAPTFASSVAGIDAISVASALALLPAGSTQTQIDAAIAGAKADKGGRSYDWEKTILQTGISYNNDISYAAGTENSKTRLSFGANNTTGIVKNSGLDKYNFGLNNSTNFLNGFLKLDSKVLYTALKDKSALISNNAGYIGNIVASALYWNPTRDTRKADGSYNVVGNDYLNPEQLQDAYTDYANTNKILASISPTLTLSKYLKYKFLFGIETSTSARKSSIAPSIKILDVAFNTYIGDGKVYYGQANVNNVNHFNRTFEHTLSFNKDLSDNFNLDVVGGYAFYNYNSDGNSITVKGFNPNNDNLIDNLAGGISYKDGDKAYGATSYNNKIDLQSFFGRATVNLYKKTYLTASARREGSSNFGADNKNATFYSLGAAYKLVDSKQGLVNDVKIRGSYGVTGNQQFPWNASLGYANYITPNNLGNNINSNTLLKWEETTTSGVGLDFTLLKNKLSGSVDYFLRDTKNLIYTEPGEATGPAPAGALKSRNLDGVLENKGIEVSLNYSIVNNDTFTWDISGNVSFLSNKIKDFVPFITTGELNGQGLSGASAQIISNNLPLYTYYMYEFRGYDTAGNSIYSDADGNNAGLGAASKKILDKQPIPKMNLGFNTNFTYKNIDAGVSFYGAFGHYIYNNTANALFFKGAFPIRNIPSGVLNSTQDKSDPNSPSTKYLEKGDFLRMGNLTFGYTFKGGAFERAHIKSARFFVNGQNLLLFTDYTGFDPEVDVNKSINGIPSAGIDYLAYPKAKTISVGLNLNF